MTAQQYYYFNILYIFITSNYVHFLILQIGWEEREWLLDNTGSKSVPNIWIKGKFVGGCNDGPAPWMGIKKIIKAVTLEDYFK